VGQRIRHLHADVAPAHGQGGLGGVLCQVPLEGQGIVHPAQRIGSGQCQPFDLRLRRHGASPDDERVILESHRAARAIRH
jgi:hypothetical protein